MTAQKLRERIEGLIDARNHLHGEVESILGMARQFGKYREVDALSPLCDEDVKDQYDQFQELIALIKKEFPTCK